jgi:hypothetical protein
MIKPLPNLLKLASLMCLIIAFTSCNKVQKGPAPEDKPQPALTAKINGTDYNLVATDFKSTYYTTDGDNAKALQTTASLDANGSKLVFFISDLKNGTITLSKKAGTSLNPGKPVQKVNATTTVAPSVQTYVQYINAGNTYYASSGTLTIAITGNTATISWNITFKDAAGKDFASTGSYTATNFAADTKPKTQIVDPTPVSATPTIESISPQQGKYNDTVTITGVNYSPVETDNVVKFNGTDAVVKLATATKLTVIVPIGGTTGNISLKVKNSETVNGPVFTYGTPPNMMDYKPKEGRAGDIITITGINFSNNIADVQVKFGNATATVVTATTTQVTIKIPPGLQTSVFVPFSISIKGVASPSIGSILIDAEYPNLTWESLASIPRLQKINQIIHMGSTLLVTGGNNANFLYYSADGKTYSDVAYNLPFNKSKKLSINVLKAYKSAYYITTNLGIAKSTNGIYWTKLTPEPTTPDTAFTGITITNKYIAVVSGNRLYRSTNGGDSWTRTTISVPGASLNYTTAITDSYSSNNFFAVDTSKNFTSKEEKLFYRSTDYGATWEATKGYTGIYYYNMGYKDFLAAASYSVFCAFSYKGAAQTEGSQYLYRSTNNGDSWTQVGTEHCNVVKADSATVVYGNQTFNLSINDGTNFKSYPMPDGYTLGGIEITNTYYYIMGFNAAGDRKMFRAVRPY